MEDLLTVQQAAAALQVSPEVLRRLIRAGEGPRAVRLSARRIRIRRVDLESFIARHHQGDPGKEEVKR
jgi:excisionase family DNA binding protein